MVGLIAERVAIPKLAFVTAWHLVGITHEPHPVLGTNRHFVMTDDASRRLTARTWTLLAELGLARRASVNPVFANTLTTIAEPDREYYGWSNTGTDHAALLVAAKHPHAIRVATNDHIVVLDPIGADWLPDDFVSGLPEVAAAVVAPTSVAADLYRNPDRRDPRKPLAEPPDTTAVNYVRALLKAPRDAVHQLYTARRDIDGERIRSVPLSAIDLTGRGRVLAYTNYDDEGHENLHVVSGTAHNLITTLEHTNQLL
ncbi:ESX secretion-associated protein EspG [Amycolatopsis lurida]